MRKIHLPLALTSVLALAVGLEKAQASPRPAEIAKSFTLPVEVTGTTRSDAAIGKPVLAGKTLTMGAAAGVPLSVAPSAGAQPESLPARLIRELRARLAPHGKTGT